MPEASLQGSLAYHGGDAAEQRIALEYERRGYIVDRRRWRGPGGEIDLILRDGERVVFVEVKKSRNFAQAAERLAHRQIQRICASASQFLAEMPNGQLTESRFDVALVDNAGRFQIIENAFGEF